MGRAHAGDGGDARGAAEPFRCRHAQTQSRGISAGGLCGADGDDGARVRHETSKREQERADGIGELTPSIISVKKRRVPGVAQHERSEWCAADPGPFQSVAVPDQRWTAMSAFTRVLDALWALHRIRDTWRRLTAAAMRRTRCSKFGDAAAPSMCRKCFGSSAS